MHAWINNKININVIKLYFYPEDGGDKFLKKVDNYLQDYMASWPRRPQSKIVVGIRNIEPTTKPDLRPLWKAKQLSTTLTCSLGTMAI